MGLLTMALTYIKESSKARQIEFNRQQYREEAKSIFTLKDEDFAYKNNLISQSMAELSTLSSESYCEYIAVDPALGELLSRSQAQFDHIKDSVIPQYQSRYADEMTKKIPSFWSLHQELKEIEKNKMKVSAKDYALSLIGIGDSASKFRKQKLEAQAKFIKEKFEHKNALASLKSNFNKEKADAVKRSNETYSKYLSFMKNQVEVAKQYMVLKNLSNTILDNQANVAKLNSTEEGRHLLSQIKSLPVPLRITTTDNIPQLPSAKDVQKLLVESGIDVTKEQIQKPEKVLSDRIEVALRTRTTTDRHSIESKNKYGNEKRAKQAHKKEKTVTAADIQKVDATILEVNDKIQKQLEKDSKYIALFANPEVLFEKYEELSTRKKQDPNSWTQDDESSLSEINQKFGNMLSTLKLLKSKKQTLELQLLQQEQDGQDRDDD